MKPCRKYDSTRLTIAMSLLGLLAVAVAQGQPPAEEASRGHRAKPVPAPRPQFTRPTVSLVSKPDPVATEHATSPDHAMVRVIRTGPIDESLVVRLTTGGSAMPGKDWGAWPERFTISAGKSRLDISLTIINDKLVEGDETVEIALKPSPAYEIGGKPATVVIHDNDHWQWAEHSGADIPKGRQPLRNDMKNLDHIGQSPAWASMDCMAEISDDSVSAKYTGKFFDGGYFSDEFRTVGDSLKMDFDFDPITGEIYLADLKGRSRVKRSGKLVGGLGVSYVTDNEGPRFHYVTVTLFIAVYVPGTITINGGPKVTGKNSPTTVPMGMTTKGGGRNWGSGFDTTTIVTLKLKPVEDND